MSSQTLAIIALGSNLGDSRQIIQTAMDRLQQYSSTPLLRSALFTSSPVDCPPGSPDFLNAVVGLIPESSESPESLLLKLQSLEREFGRQPKTVANEARSLDLDLVAFGQERRSSSELTLPHPRAQLRRFVLEPLAEIAPDLILPGQTETVATLLALLTSTEELKRID